MISLSDAIRLESNNPAVNTFKPWWEVGVDYTLNAFLLIVLFALAGVTISGTPGLVCLPENNNITSFNYATINYVNAKCTTHVNGHVLIIFPYIIFVQWLLLFVLHLSWFNLPALKAFLSSSFDTFTAFKQMGQSRPQAKLRKQSSPAELEKKLEAEEEKLREDHEESDDDSEQLESGRHARFMHLVDWLQYLLQFKYNLVNMYTAKSLAICTFTMIALTWIISWLVTFRWKAAFTCDLHGSIPAPYDRNECSFAAAPYVYSMMILNAIISVFLFIFNFRALLWLAGFIISYRHYFRSWKGEHPFRDKPGFYDYFFCVKLLKSNSPEGLVVFETMQLAFKAFASKTPEETATVSDYALAIPEEPRYRRNRFICTEVLRELGRVHKRSVDSRDDLWVALANSLEQDTLPISREDVGRVTREIRETIIEQLMEKNMLFKDLINKDDHCPVFEDYLEDIKENKLRNNGIIEDHYVLMAYAIAYRLNVVVIRAKESSLLYEPERPEENQSVRFIVFVPPCYYFATSSDPNASAEQKDAGLMFLTDQIYQTKLVKKVNEMWESEGYENYVKTLEKVLPQELSYQSETIPKQFSKAQLEKKERLRFRFKRSVAGSDKSTLMEAV